MYINELSKYLEELSNNRSRNVKTELLSQLFKDIDVSEIKEVIYMLDGRVGPRFEPLEYNFSNKLMIRALMKVFPDEKLQDDFDKLGDLGLVVERVSSIKQDRKKVKVEIGEVFGILRSIAECTGHGSQDAKIEKASRLISILDPLSGKYVTRMIIGNLRLGLNDKTILDGLSWYLGNNKEKRSLLDRAFGVRSDLGVIAEMVKSGHVDDLSKLSIMVGMPVASKLVEREKDADSIYQRLQDCILQPKFDGLRAQIHFQKNGISILSKNTNKNGEQNFFDLGAKNDTLIFSRNMENMTEMFPDIVQNMKRLKVDSIVLDSEVIGFDSTKNKYIPFQETIQRKRKYGVKDIIKNIPIKVYIFDCLYINGIDISTRPLVFRLSQLDKLNFSDTSIFEKAESTEIKSVEEMKNKFKFYVERGLEGIIVKDKESLYNPGTRDFDWIKLKASSNEGSIDSIDGVVLGYYYGKGQRAKFGMGALLIGIYNDKKDEFVSIAKLGTGIKDEQWANIKRKLDIYKVSDKPDNVIVNNILKPDVWILPQIVVEVEYDQISRSRNHGEREGNIGYSLRFPRMKIFERDKLPNQATTFSEVERMFKLQ